MNNMNIMGKQKNNKKNRMKDEHSQGKGKKETSITIKD